MKALAKEPDRRYQSAAELARDIRHYLAGEPIEAKRTSSWYLVGKAIRRHKLPVALATALFVLTVASAITLAFLLVRVGTERDNAVRAQREAEAAELRATHRFDQVRTLARSFIFDFHGKIRDLKGATPAREFLVTTALEYLDSLAQEASDDASLMQELAFAYAEVGDVQGSPGTANLGDTAGALESYRKGMQIVEALARNDPDDGEAQQMLAYMHTRLGDVHAVTGQTAQALTEHEASLRIREAQASAAPDDIRAQVFLATGHSRIADVRARQGQLAAAQEGYHRALEIYESLAVQIPENKRIRRSTVICLDRIADTLRMMNQPAKALAAYERGLALKRAMFEETPDDVWVQSLLAVSYTRMGDMQDSLGRPDEALAGYEKSLELRQGLVDADPMNANALHDLTVSLDRIGYMQAASRDHQRALETYGKSLEIRRQLVESDPANTGTRHALSISLERVAEMLAETGHLDEALEHYNQTVEIRRQIAEADPMDAHVARDLATSEFNLAVGHMRTGDDEARSAEERVGHWVEARRWFHKAQAGLGALRESGALPAAEEPTIGKIAVEIARCDSQIEQLDAAASRAVGVVPSENVD